MTKRKPQPSEKEVLNTKYGKLQPIKKVKNKPNGHQAYLCLCDCGNEKVIILSNFKTGHTSSCGCARVEYARSEKGRARTTTHGQVKSLTYSSWSSMKSRCNNKKHDNYPLYGGRGIKVCDRWLNSFESFFEDMGERPSLSYTLDRINVNGNYEPDNCKWATKIEQSLNRREKIGSSGYPFIHKGGEGSYRARVKRSGVQRGSYMVSLEDAIEIRDIYLSEYNSNPEEWVENTKNNNYLKRVEDL